MRDKRRSAARPAGFPFGKKDLSANESAFRSIRAEDPFYETSPNSSLIQYQYLDLISLYCAKGELGFGIE
jgi:hypothetical protein